MEITWITFAIVCPLVFLAGFVDSIAGGGGLISLPAYLIAGLPTHAAIATNKLSSAMGTTLTTANYARKGFIPLKQAIGCVICALIGSGIGANLALLVNDRYFKFIMVLILPLTAYYVIRSQALIAEKEPYPPLKTALLSMAVALPIGMYDGFYGPGTGTFLILLLTGLAHMRLEKANGVAKAINLTTNYTSLYVYLTNGKVMLLLGLVSGLFCLAGNWLGSNMFIHGGSKSTRPIMIFVLVLFFVKVLFELIG